MILWLNGPFGVGKTTTTRALLAARPDARAHDPERLGHVLGRLLRHRGDYQELPSWRRGTVLGVARRAGRSRGGVLVVPMTLQDPDVADEVLGGLRARGRALVHVTLDASPDVLRHRIDTDEREPDARVWRHLQLDRWADARPHLAARGPVVDTDARTVDEVVDAVLGAAGLR